MNPWTSPPSPGPSMDASSSDPSTAFAFLVHIASTVPRQLLDAYVTYLWYYRPDSWVGRVASAFRVLAFVLVLPIVLLTLLDVTSYVIARTLGVVDDVKTAPTDADATTSPNSTKVLDLATALPAPARAAKPSTFSHARRVPEGEEDRASAGLMQGEDGNGRGCASEGVIANSHGRAHAYYFAADEDLRLAGEGVFSVPSSPLSPLDTFFDNDGRDVGQASEGIALRRAQAVREVEGHHA